MDDKTLTLFIDGEQREFKQDSLSEAANQKIAQIQFYNQSIAPIFSEVMRLAQLGSKVDQGDLSSLLPKDYVVVQNEENKVKSDNKEETSSEETS
jgi:hypothetical protein